ncbi:hypothetical protein LCGC14_1495530 [marine sediment metagenome]|uniref:Uncharacterized protein n=1 Tax=marine sediment metagenome TaxID=412755 RepID=A0A0F9LL23_9ZZZZ
MSQLVDENSPHARRRKRILAGEEELPSTRHEDMAKSCPCEYEEVEPCHNACTCRNPVMSGGCQRCCRYGRVEQRVARAKRLVEK